MERWAGQKRTDAVLPSGGDVMFSAIAAFFRGLFSPKEDDFKSLLISDLGIER
jgi:hypothetical protein